MQEAKFCIWDITMWNKSKRTVFLPIVLVILALSSIPAGCGNIQADEDVLPSVEIQELNFEENRDSVQETEINIIGTWWNTLDTQNADWNTFYRTSFSQDGQVVHYGRRNVDFGKWEQAGNTIKAYFDNCYYLGIAGETYMLPAYDVTYSCQKISTDNGQEVILNRTTDRKAEMQTYIATDFDDYDSPLFYNNAYSEVDEECYYLYAHFPGIVENNDLLEQRLLEIAGTLAEGEEVQLERDDIPYTIERFATFDFTGDGRDEIIAYVEPIYSAVWNLMHDNEGAVYIISPISGGGYTILAKNTDFRRGYTDILASDGTELLSWNSYMTASSWHGGIRFYLGYREGQIVVDKKERYHSHWGPLINRINDYKNGTYYVYVARTIEEDVSSGIIELYEDGIKIDEEYFEPVLIPLTGFEPDENGNDYPALYDSVHPFTEGWWEEGGYYPEDGDIRGIGMADWIDKAANDNPDEMLKEAVEKSGYEMTKMAYPWTEETKQNVMELLRCPVADYYYISDEHIAFYARGEIYFYKR